MNYIPSAVLPRRSFLEEETLPDRTCPVPFPRAFSSSDQFIRFPSPSIGLSLPARRHYPWERFCVPYLHSPFPPSRYFFFLTPFTRPMRRLRFSPDESPRSWRRPVGISVLFPSVERNSEMPFLNPPFRLRPSAALNRITTLVRALSSGELRPPVELRSMIESPSIRKSSSLCPPDSKRLLGVNVGFPPLFP